MHEALWKALCLDDADQLLLLLSRYSDSQLDQQFIDVLREACYRLIDTSQVSTYTVCTTLVALMVHAAGSPIVWSYCTG